MHLHPLPAFSDNYIWTLSTDDGRALIVDPGEAGPVLAAAQNGLQPVGILLTHHHHDHIGGTGELLRKWPDRPVIAPEDDRISLATQRVGGGDQAVVAGCTFDVTAGADPEAAPARGICPFDSSTSTRKGTVMRPFPLRNSA